MKYHLTADAIIVETHKALLIQVPDKTYAFWYPKRFCRLMGRNQYTLEIWAANHFDTKTFYHKKKSDNVVHERILLRDLLSNYIYEEKPSKKIG